MVDPTTRSVVIFAREPGSLSRFDAGTTWTSGAAPSRLLPGLALTIDQVFA